MIRTTLLALLLTVGTASAALAEDSFDYHEYAAVLRARVDEAGLVNYRALKADREGLDRYVESLGHLAPSDYARWSEAAKIAFWLNAYNARTLQVIIDHYPIQSGLFTSLVYPRNSIRQISGVWDALTFSVMGSSYTLDAIEHEVLRKKFHEPRIHVALVCASKGCPVLRSEPYVGDRLSVQLDDQAHRFLSRPESCAIDHTTKRVTLSPIFKWFGEDFIPAYGGKFGESSVSEAERAVLHFVSLHASEDDRRFLERNPVRVEYGEYDWSLNEQ